MQTYSLDKNINLPQPVYEALAALSDANFFSDGLLVGSWALLFYKELFGIEYVLRTDDIDFALRSDAAKEKSGTDLEAALSQKGFDPVIDLLSGLQKFLAGTFEIEFLIHRRGGRDEIVTVGKYNINAQPLPFLDLLFFTPIEVRLADFKVCIPSPESLFLHKLIIAQRRKKESKRVKDLEQCATLTPHLDAGKLAELVRHYRMSKETVRSIRKSCDTIDFRADFLQI
jgi:hypothetical protein